MCAVRKAVACSGTEPWKDVKDVRRARKLKSTMCINKLHWSCRYGGPWGTRTPDIYPVNLS